jgi:hypothetical protein
MQVVKNILLAMVTFWFAILLFMPKIDLYYTLENMLVKQGIEINEKSIDEKVFSLVLKEADVFVQGIKVVRLNRVNIFTLLFYSKIKVDGVNIDDSLKSFIPGTVEEIVANHSVFSPFKMFLHIKGSFGFADGTLNLKNRKVRLNFANSKKLNNIKKELKKDDKGWYYEKSF